MHLPQEICFVAVGVVGGGSNIQLQFVSG